MFSELDNGSANLQEARRKIDIYRQSVLKKAFEGELTNPCRYEIDMRKHPKGWKFIKMGNIAKIGTGATPKRGHKAYWENGTVPWVTSGAVNNPYVTSAEEYITNRALQETNCKIALPGSLLVAMYGEGKTRGKCSELKIEAATNQAIAIITLENEAVMLKSYLKWFFIMNYENIRLLSSGGVQPNLNLSIIKNTSIPLPETLEEQTQIVQEIESRLSVCDKLIETIDTSLKQAEALRQSILKKAFEGGACC
ncbi:MAG: restriction endonuclease subunit S [Verrucomicrobia bacterium]|nr:restriction endonuclease subunit S [Verrucomicrobiota bacterium]